VIWQKKGEEVELCETSGPDYEEKFIKAVAHYVVEALGISWPDRGPVKNILVSAIRDEVEDLLTQFLHSQLEIIGKSFNQAFGIEAEIETGHAPHAKMSQFIGAIKEKYG